MDSLYFINARENDGTIIVTPAIHWEDAIQKYYLIKAIFSSTYGGVIKMYECLMPTDSDMSEEPELIFNECIEPEDEEYDDFGEDDELYDDE